MSGEVYFIACTLTNRVKIGFTTGDPRARLKALQTGAPAPLRLLAVQPGSIETERDLHGQFSSCHVHGEWFQPDDDLVRHMLSVVFVAGSHAAHGGYEPDDWVLAGLALLSTEFGPLPPHLAALLTSCETMQ